MSCDGRVIEQDAQRAFEYAYDNYDLDVAQADAFAKWYASLPRGTDLEQAFTNWWYSGDTMFGDPEPQSEGVCTIYGPDSERMATIPKLQPEHTHVVNRGAW